MKIGVFCSANNTIDADFFAETEALGAWIAAQGHAIVYGGCNCGLMECVGKAVHLHGGQTIGVIPRIIASKTIGYHQKGTILYNMKDFFNPLINLLDDLQAQQMIRGKWQDYIQTANNLTDIAALLQDMA